MSVMSVLHWGREGAHEGLNIPSVHSYDYIYFYVFDVSVAQGWGWGVLKKGLNILSSTLPHSCALSMDVPHGHLYHRRMYCFFCGGP